MSRYSDLVLSLAPVAYWRLGEASGTVAADLTGSYPGTYVGSPTLGVTGALTGDSNTAVTLNGTTQYANTGVPTTFAAGTGAFTVAAWVNHTPDANSRRIFSSEGASQTNGVYASSASGTIAFRRCEGGAVFDTATATALTAGWHFCVFTYDGATMRIYVDGAVSGTPVASSRSISPGQPLRLGSYGHALLNPFNGSMDEAAAWSRALTAAEIAQLYATGTAAISGSTAIAQALALRFAPGTITAPSGYRAMRTSTYALPNQLPPTPCVLVFPDSGDFSTGNGTRTGTQHWTVRFYYDQTQDLARESVALLGWLDVLTTQLRATSQLGGLVARATVDAWSIGVLTYADQPYAGIELKVTTVTSESWSAAA